jgi:hypothetical protein
VPPIGSAVRAFFDRGDRPSSRTVRGLADAAEEHAQFVARDRGVVSRPYVFVRDIETDRDEHDEI